MLLRALGQIAFDVILLEIDERRTRMAGFGQQVERVDQFVLKEHLADVPAHALLDHRVAAAEAVEDFERAFGKADRARSAGERVVVVDEHGAHALLGQIDRCGKPDRPRADHDDRINGGRVGVVIGGALVVEPQRLIVDLHDISVS